MQEALEKETGRETGRTNGVCWPWLGLGVFKVTSVDRGKSKELNGGRQRAAGTNRQGLQVRGKQAKSK